MHDRRAGIGWLEARHFEVQPAFSQAAGLLLRNGGHFTLHAK
jgi:hypothetical protein